MLFSYWLNIFDQFNKLLGVNGHSSLKKVMNCTVVPQSSLVFMYADEELW